MAIVAISVASDYAAPIIPFVQEIFEAVIGVSIGVLKLQIEVHRYMTFVESYALDLRVPVVPGSEVG